MALIPITQAQAIAGIGSGGYWTPSATITVGGVTTSLPLLGGSITVDATSYSRRKLTLQLPQSYAPVLGTDLTAPLGNEVVVSVTFLPYNYSPTVYAGYSWQLGVFGITGYHEQDGAAKSFDLYGADRADRIARISWDDKTSPITIAAGTALDVAVNSVLSYARAYMGVALPALSVIGSMPTTGTAPIYLGASQQGDPWQEMADNLVKPLGYQIYIDAMGTPTLAPAAQVNTSVWTVQDGTGGALLDFSRDGDITGVVNYVVVEAESSYGVPYRGIKSITDTNSPVAPLANGGGLSKFGYRFMHTIEPNITSADSASQRAAVVLTNNSSLPESVTIQTIPNPSLDALQTITVIRNKVTRNVQIQQMTIDLGGAPMQIAGRVTSASR